jgi:hypothetical protein
MTLREIVLAQALRISQLEAQLAATEPPEVQHGKRPRQRP